MSILLPRRHLLAGLAAAIAAPIIIKYSHLMPVKVMPMESDLDRLWKEIREFDHFWAETKNIASQNTLLMTGTRDITEEALSLIGTRT